MCSLHAVSERSFGENVADVLLVWRFVLKAFINCNVDDTSPSFILFGSPYIAHERVGPTLDMNLIANFDGAVLHMPIKPKQIGLLVHNGAVHVKFVLLLGSSHLLHVVPGMQGLLIVQHRVKMLPAMNFRVRATFSVVDGQMDTCTVPCRGGPTLAVAKLAESRSRSQNRRRQELAT